MATDRETDHRETDQDGESRHVPAQRANEAMLREPQQRHEQRRPMTKLLRELAYEGTALLRAEATLAKIEMREGLQEVQRGILSGVTGAAILTTGLLALVASAILALALVWPAWLAALVIGGVLAVVGGILVGVAKRKMKARELVPERFIDSLKDNREFVREEMKMARENVQ